MRLDSGCSNMNTHRLGGCMPYLIQNEYRHLGGCMPYFIHEMIRHGKNSEPIIPHGKSSKFCL